MLTLLVVLLILMLVFGGYGHSRGDWGYYGWSPAALLLVLILVFWLTGVLR